MSTEQLRHRAHCAWLRSRAYYATPFHVFWYEYQLNHLQECVA